MIRSIRLIVTFYNTFIIPSILISLLSAVTLMKSGLSFFIVVFWFKLISMASIITFINSYRKKEFFYYQNLGLSKLALWSGSLVIDFVLFLALLIFAYQLR